MEITGQAAHKGLIAALVSVYTAFLEEIAPCYPMCLVKLSFLLLPKDSYHHI
jgi:hypothetical protein